MAAALFKKKLCGNGMIIYVISEKEQLALLPEGCIRVLVTASLGTIRERFAVRMHGDLPAPVASMLERKYVGLKPQHMTCVWTQMPSLRMRLPTKSGCCLTGIPYIFEISY